MAQVIEYIENMAGNFRLFNFATGSYTCRCCICGSNFLGDKRAVQCLACAIKAAEEKFTSTNTGSPKLPSSTEVWTRVVDHCITNKLFCSVESARSISQMIYEFISRQLRAGA
jgi:hypothetical protein